MKYNQKLFIFIFVFFTNQLLTAQTTATSTIESNSQLALEPTKIDDLKALDYPELQVVPRASERLAQEVEVLNDRGTWAMFPYTLPSLMTLTSAIVVSTNARQDMSDQAKEDTTNYVKFATGVGAVSLGVVYWYTYTDGYNSTLSKIRSIKSKDKRSLLLKERMAEEVFEKSSTLITKWKWFFVTTNFIACAQLMSRTKGDYNVIPSLGVLTSLMPLFVSTSYETNYERQQEYKRRIYVPLTWFDYQYEIGPKEQAYLQPRINALWTF